MGTGVGRGRERGWRLDDEHKGTGVGAGTKKARLFRRRKHKPLFIEIHRTTRGILVLYLYFRVSGTLGPGFSGAARFSLSRRAHVNAKGTLGSVEQNNYAVGEQKVGQPRRPTSCVLSFVEAEN